MAASAIVSIHRVLASTAVLSLNSCQDRKQAPSLSSTLITEILRGRYWRPVIKALVVGVHGSPECYSWGPVEEGQHSLGGLQLREEAPCSLLLQKSPVWGPKGAV